MLFILIKNIIIYYNIIMSSKSNGGFPPLKIIKETKQSSAEVEQVKKERYYAPKIKELNIKNILSNSIVKPMIEIKKSKIDIIDNL